MISATDNKQLSSKKADVYSFGVILYELIGKQGPFGKHYQYSDDSLRGKTIPEDPGPDNVHATSYMQLLGFAQLSYFRRFVFCI